MTFNSCHKRVAAHVNDVQEMVNVLVQQVFSYEIEAIAASLTDLVKENQTLGGTLNAFIYSGKTYSLIQNRFIRGLSINPLHPSLEAQADRYIDRQDRVITDHRRIINSMSVVTNKCTSRQDIRDVLPETLVVLVPQLAQMERLREEGFLIKFNPVLKKQFQDTVNLLLDYQANRLLY